MIHEVKICPRRGQAQLESRPVDEVTVEVGVRPCIDKEEVREGTLWPVDVPLDPGQFSVEQQGKIRDLSVKHCGVFPA